MFALAIERAHVRSKELVWRADQEIVIDLFNVHQTTRSKMHSINKCHCAGGMAQARDLSNRIDCSDGVGGITDTDELCPAIQLSFEVLEIQGAVLLVNICNPDDHPLLFKRPPWREIGIMIQNR